MINALITQCGYCSGPVDLKGLNVGQLMAAA